MIIVSRVGLIIFVMFYLRKITGVYVNMNRSFLTAQAARFRLKVLSSEMDQAEIRLIR